MLADSGKCRGLGLFIEMGCLWTGGVNCNVLHDNGLIWLTAIIVYLKIASEEDSEHYQHKEVINI